MQANDKRVDYGKLLSRILSGLLGLGGVLGAFRDADFVTWQIASAGTLIMVLGWVGIQFYLRHHPIQIGNYKVKKLKGYYAWPLVGMAVLLWLPAIWPDPAESHPDPVEVVVLQTSTPSPLPTDTPAPTPLPFPPREEDENLIVILKFARTEGVVDVNPHVEIRDSIEAQLNQLNLNQKIRVEIEPTSVDPLGRPDEARQEAESIAKLYDANLVIWGVDTGIRTRVGFANLAPGYDNPIVKETLYSNVYKNIDTTEETQLVDPQEYSEFILDKLPNGLEFLSLYALGLVTYFNDDYEDAEIMLTQAVDAFNRTGFDAREFRLDQVYMILAGVYLDLGDADGAYANVDNALELNPQNVIAMLIGASTAATLNDSPNVELRTDRMINQCEAFANSLNVLEITICLIMPMAGSEYFSEIDSDLAVSYMQKFIYMIEEYGDRSVFSSDEEQEELLSLAYLTILMLEAENIVELTPSP